MISITMIKGMEAGQHAIKCKLVNCAGIGCSAFRGCAIEVAVTALHRRGPGTSARISTVKGIKNGQHAIGGEPEYGPVPSSSSSVRRSIQVAVLTQYQRVRLRPAYRTLK